MCDCKCQFEVREKIPTSWQSTSSSVAAGRATQTALPSPVASPGWPRSPAAAPSPQRQRQHYFPFNQEEIKTTRKQEIMRTIVACDWWRWLLSERIRVRLYLWLPGLHWLDPPQINGLINFLSDRAVCFVLLDLCSCLVGEIVLDLDCLQFDGLVEKEASKGVSL